jgi:AraC-like DNA-binding protein
MAQAGTVQIVDRMAITALDLGFRGAVAGLLLMVIVLVLLRIRPLNSKSLLGAAMSANGIVYAIATAPFVPRMWLWCSIPVLCGIPVVFWLWARATFDDDFILKRWHGALWIGVVGFDLWLSLAWTSWPLLTRAGSRALALVQIGLALAATVQTLQTWRADLVAGRRRLRLAVLISGLVFIVLETGSGLVSNAFPIHQGHGSLAVAIGLFAVAMLVGPMVFGPPVTSAAVAAMKAEGFGPSNHRATATAAIDHNADPVAPLLLLRLDTLMTVERIYRREGLSIGMLAVKLDLPEYRLRQVINEGLGYRNFNAFLNRYRIDEAKAALADPTQKQVPVLTIAMDAGFQSIGPFNRAFKAATQQTPTEFRRDALASSPATSLENRDNLKIGQSG